MITIMLIIWFVIVAILASLFTLTVLIVRDNDRLIKEIAEDLDRPAKELQEICKKDQEVV